MTPLKENEAKIIIIVKIIFVVFSIMPQLLSIELNLHWTQNIYLTLCWQTS